MTHEIKMSAFSKQKLNTYKSAVYISALAFELLTFSFPIWLYIINSEKTTRPLIIPKQGHSLMLLFELVHHFKREIWTLL